MTSILCWPQVLGCLLCIGVIMAIVVVSLVAALRESRQQLEAVLESSKGMAQAQRILADAIGDSGAMGIVALAETVVDLWAKSQKRGIELVVERNSLTEQLPQLHACREIVEQLAKQDGPYCGVCGCYGDHAPNCLRVQARLVLERRQSDGGVIEREVKT